MQQVARYVFKINGNEIERRKKYIYLLDLRQTWQAEESLACSEVLGTVLERQATKNVYRKC